MDEKDIVNLRTFNTAKVYAEQILFPLMFDFKKFLRQANYGSDELANALIINEEIRSIQRFNGLKAMAETTYDLLQAISSTVRLKGSKIEAAKLNELIIDLQKAKLLFYERREDFFYNIYKDGVMVEVINRDFFEKVKKIIEVCYVNSEILMTKNKLLFSDSKEDYLTDEEIREQIKREYIEG